MDRIDFHALNTFLVVAQHQHLGKAAEALHTDQSTVSRKIGRLEAACGILLFERVGRSIRLTSAGTRLIPRVERLLHDLQEAIAEAKEAMGADTGEVRIGFLHTIGTSWLPQRLAQFLQIHPKVRFTLKEGEANEIVSSVLGGDLEVCILGPPPKSSQLEIVPLFREQISVVVPKNHWLAEASSCTLRDLENEPLILPRSKSGLRKIVDGAFDRQGINERVAYEGDDFTIVQSLVEAGLGATLLPMPLPSPSDKIVVIPLRDPAISRTMALCWDRRRTLPPAALTFVKALTSSANPSQP